MKSFWVRIVIVLSIIGSSTLFLLPNFTERNIEVIFHEYTRDEDGNLFENTPERVRDFILDRENGFGLYFPRSECHFEGAERFKESHRCVFRDRFVTAARVNELSQAHPELIDELFTRIMVHPVEDFFGFLSERDYKSLTIRLGLDLQGGMRATFRADFESYLESLREKYLPVVAEIERDLARGNHTERDRIDLEQRLSSINEQLTLSELRRQELLSEARTIIEKRLAAQNLTEPELRVQPASYSIAVDMPGVGNSSEVLDNIRDTVTVEYRIVDDEWSERINRDFPDSIEQLQSIYRAERVDEFLAREILADVASESGLAPEDGRLFLYWRRGRARGTTTLPREFIVLGPVVMDGGDMTNATHNANPNSGWYDINFELSGAGSEKFGQITTENVGRKLAILWGDRVVSNPVINSPIVGGHGQITGDFDIDDAREISNVIREGALPLPLEILSVSFVGPSLGQESIAAGVLSVVLGFILVNFFMIGYYRLVGFIAVTALLLNLVLMTGVLSLLEFTLTLPGFAGLILTVGMAVDANVIIFERIKEELELGKAPTVAVDNGFQSSFWTILDANVTTLIAAIVLFYNGDGPIKGFAITLFFGLVCSMFTALYVSRLIFDLFNHFVRPKTLIAGQPPAEVSQ